MAPASTPKRRAGTISSQEQRLPRAKRNRPPSPSRPICNPAGAAGQRK
jgi:hypothetical protein